MGADIGPVLFIIVLCAVGIVFTLGIFYSIIKNAVKNGVKEFYLYTLKGGVTHTYQSNIIPPQNDKNRTDG